MYPGVNAHLNSRLLQPDGGWEMFHAEHIVAIRQLLDAILPPHYYAASEKSLQVSAVDDRAVRRAIPDIGVYQTDPHPGTTTNGSATAPTAILPIDNTLLDDEALPHAVNIYRLEAGKMPGHLVTRLEVLSPANKPGGSHYAAYRQGRRETLRELINLIEIDYLHTTHPIESRIPSYPDQETAATPYYVLITDPHPELLEGKTAHFAVAVDQPLPRLTILLAAGETIIFDLQAAYHQTVSNARILRLLADPTQPLAQPERYSTADQTRIHEMIRQHRTSLN